MEPEASKWIQELINIGGQAAVLWVALYYLLRVLKAQYDDRITALQKHSEQCEADYKALHQQMHELEREHSAAVERWMERLEALRERIRGHSGQIPKHHSSNSDSVS